MLAALLGLGREGQHHEGDLLLPKEIVKVMERIRASES
jgi:hypothetical protein